MNFIKASKSTIKKALPKPTLKYYYKINRFVENCLKPIFSPPNTLKTKMSFPQRIWFVRKINRIDRNVKCAHSQYQVLDFIGSFLSIPQSIDGCVVEAGSYKGGGTAKFSIAAKLANRELVVFDSFEGLPDNKEPHDKGIAHDKDIPGKELKGLFKKGFVCGTLEEVKNNIKKYGEIEICTFIKGWFEDTMPNFSKKICAIYLDVDLASSTKTCLKYLYPLLVPGGVLYSQDGDFPLVIEVFDSNEFWEKEVGCQKPHIEGLGEKKLIKIVKPIF